MNIPQAFLLPDMRRIIGTLLLALILTTSYGCGASRSKAEEAERQGEYALASGLYAQLYRRTPARASSLRAYYAWHTAENYRLGRIYTRALNFYRTAERYAYPDSALVLRLGQMYQATGDYPKAIEYYERYRMADPDSYLAHIGLIGSRNALNGLPKSPVRYRVQRANEWSSGASDFAPMYSQDGAYLYICSSRGRSTENKSAITGERPHDMWVVHRDQNQLWRRKIDTIPGSLNTAADEGAGSLTSDGNTIYYTYAEQSDLYPRTAQIYRASRSNDKGWSNGSVVDVWRDSVTMAAHPAITPSGTTLYFVSDVLGGAGGKDIYRVSLSGNSIGTPVPIGAPINTSGDELYPYAPTDSLLYFASDGHPGFGGLDLYKARLLPSGIWRVEHLPSPINSSADDFSLCLDPVQNADPENILSERGAFASTRDDARGRPHLYRFELPKITTLIGGYVMDREEYAIPGATIRLVGNKGGGERISHSREDGSYGLSAEGEVSYVMLASAPGYLNQYVTLSTAKADSSEVYQVDFRLASRQATEVLTNVYYGFDSAEIAPHSFEALRELQQILSDNPDITIELSAHADRHGSPTYNEQLSLRRAEAVVDYLIAQGIPRHRLRPTGYGQRKPASVSKRQSEHYPFLTEGQELTPEYILTLTKEEQNICDALCRRTEFTVLPTTIQEP